MLEPANCFNLDLKPIVSCRIQHSFECIFALERAAVIGNAKDLALTSTTERSSRDPPSSTIHLGHREPD